MIDTIDDANEKSLFKLFNQNQYRGFLLVLKKFKDGLSLDDLIIEARLSENTVLCFLRDSSAEEVDGLFRLPQL